MSTAQQGRIYTGDELTQDTTVECDVCIIGSGSGGSWLAHELGAKGLSVVMLEEGGYHTRRDFDMTEARAYPALYQDLGNRTTDDLSIRLDGDSVTGFITRANRGNDLPPGTETLVECPILSVNINRKDTNEPDNQAVRNFEIVHVLLNC